MKKIKNVLIIFLILVLISFIFYLKIARAQEIEVTNTKVKSLISLNNFVGVNWFDDNTVFRSMLSNPTTMTELGKTLQELNIDTIRYPGGHNIWSFFWEVPTDKIYTALSKLPEKDTALIFKPTLKSADRLNFYDFLMFCKSNKLKAIIQVNTQLVFDKEKNEIIPLKSYKRDKENRKIKDSGVFNKSLINKAAQYAAEEVKWVTDNGYSDTVLYWELGNEEYNRFNMGVGFSGDEYAEVAAKFIEAMKKQNPDIRILLTNSIVVMDLLKNPASIKFLFQNEWTQQILNNISIQKNKNNIYAVTNHLYLGNSIKNNNFTDFMNYVFDGNGLNIEKYITPHLLILNRFEIPNKKIFIDEFNSHWFDRTYAHTWLAAIANANAIMSCANTVSCDHMDYHNLVHYYGCYSGKNYNQGFGLIHYAKDFQYPFIIYPDAQVISLLNKYLKGDVVLTNSNDKQVISTATVIDNKLQLIILNKVKARDINIKFSNFKINSFNSNESIGINVPLAFTNMNESDSCSNPTEVRSLNILENALKLKQDKNGYIVTIPANTLAVFVFKIG